MKQGNRTVTGPLVEASLGRLGRVCGISGPQRCTRQMYCMNFRCSVIESSCEIVRMVVSDEISILRSN